MITVLYSCTVTRLHGRVREQSGGSAIFCKLKLSIPRKETMKRTLFKDIHYERTSLTTCGTNSTQVICKHNWTSE